MQKVQRLALFGATLAAAMMAATCGEPELKDINGDGIDDSNSTTTVVSPISPTGTVSGLIYDAETNLPMVADKSVKVHLVAGSMVEMFDVKEGDGVFTFEDVPAGVGVSLTIESEGYATAVVQTALVAAAGNFPTNNSHVLVGPIELVKLSGSLTTLLIAPDGRAISGAMVYVDTDFGFFNDGAVVGRVHASAVTDDQGMATIVGLPDAATMNGLIPGQSFVVTVPPPDLDGDDVPDYNGATTTLTVGQVAVQAAPVTIVLGYPTGASPLKVIASNIADLVGAAPTPVPTPSVLPKQGSIYIAFNQPVNADSFLFQMVGEEGGVPFPVSPTIDNYGNIVHVPLPSNVQQGQEYNLYVEARPQQIGAGGGYRGAVAFFIEANSLDRNSIQASSFRHEERTHDLLINGGDYIWFRLDVPVGARTDDGSPTPVTNGRYTSLLPVRVQVAGIDVDNSGNPTGQDHPFEHGYSGTELPPIAYIVEKIPEGGQYSASGYSTNLLLELPIGVQLDANSTPAFHFVFNDPVGAVGGQTYRISSPQGVLPEPPQKQGQLVFDPTARGDAG